MAVNTTHFFMVLQSGSLLAELLSLFLSFFIKSLNLILCLFYGSYGNTKVALGPIHFFNCLNAFIHRVFAESFYCYQFTTYYFTTQNTTIVTTNAICKLIDYAGTINTSQQYINHWPVMLLFCSGYLQMHRFVFG